MKRRIKPVLSLLGSAALAVLLAGCDNIGGSDALKVGGKDFTESRILSEMMAQLAEANEIPVVRRIGLGNTLQNLESLKGGDIDLYAEYNGTGLVMVGLPPVNDGNEAMRQVKEYYEPLGLSWGERFGFANNYGLAMLPSRADELGVETISDVSEIADTLTIGIDSNFSSRPVDGYQPLQTRYGMSFAETVVVEPDERISLFDHLLAGEADVVEVFLTDGQIADLGLTVLEDDLEFFPVYEAAPLVRADAYTRFPALRDALAQLGGKLDESTMQTLNLQVDGDALSPATVARAALIDMGLIDGDAQLEINEPVLVALSQGAADSPESGRALRAIREAYPERRVLLSESDDPIAAINSGAARLAIANAVEFNDVGDDGQLVTRAAEAVGVAGLEYVHVIAIGDASNWSGVSSLYAGRPGTASYRAAQNLAAGADGIELIEGDDPFDAAAADANGADAMIVVAPAGSARVSSAIEGRRLLSLEDWAQGDNLLRFPTLRKARLPQDSYPGQFAAVETLSTQLLIAGPHVENTDAVGPQGPGATSLASVSALSPDSIMAISSALGTGLGIDPAVPIAAALAPALPPPPAALDARPDLAILTMVIFAMIAWMLWLYARPATTRH